MILDYIRRMIDAVIIGRLNDGKRFLSRLEKDDEVLEAMTNEEFIGRHGRVRVVDGYNIFKP